MAARPAAGRPAPDADELRRRHDAYVWQVNAAVAAGHDALARELADTYLDEYLDDHVADRLDDSEDDPADGGPGPSTDPGAAGAN